MTRHLRRSATSWFVFGCLFILARDGDGRTASASADAVRPLIRAFNLTQQRAIAAADPHQPGFFTAAVYTGTDLFLVYAQHPAADELEQRIRSRQYQRVFFALRATPTTSGKFYIYDAGADGVRTSGRANEAVDELRENAVRIVRFNGDANGQGLTKTAYAETLTAADARYAQLLTRLPLGLER